VKKGEQSNVLDEPAVDETIPDDEVDAAASALKTLWECERANKARSETGYGPSYRYLAQVALTAARHRRDT
jgi:hypothetical protein